MLPKVMFADSDEKTVYNVYSAMAYETKTMVSRQEISSYVDFYQRYVKMLKRNNDTCPLGGTIRDFYFGLYRDQQEHREVVLNAIEQMYEQRYTNRNHIAFRGMTLNGEPGYWCVQCNDYSTNFYPDYINRGVRTCRVHHNNRN